MAYVIKEWFADETPNADGVYINIKGREGGLVSFLLSLVGIDPTVTMVVDKENVRFQEGSWSGFFQRITPVGMLCSGGYGYAKPWKSAVVMAVLGFPLLPFFGLGLILILGAILYYFLNKEMKLEFSDIGGRTSAIEFKRSVIEGLKVDEREAARVIRILEALTQGKPPQREISPPVQKSAPVFKPLPEPTVGAKAQEAVNATVSPAAFCPNCGERRRSNLMVCASCGASLT